MVCTLKKIEISEDFKSVIKNAANKLSGAKRREYIGEITIEFPDGNARKAKREFGRGRETVKRGMAELTTGIKCLNNYSARGNKKTKEKCLNSPLTEDPAGLLD